jgi:hypothetical protein
MEPKKTEILIGQDKKAITLRCPYKVISKDPEYIYITEITVRKE